MAAGRSYFVRVRGGSEARANATAINTYSVDLTEIDLKRSVSRRHARIVRADGAFSLIEEGGVLNGTFVNGTQLVSGEPHPIKDGDCIGLGTVRVIFRAG